MSNKRRIAPALMLLMILALLVAACGGETPPAETPGEGTPTETASGPACEGGTLTFDGSSAFYPLAEEISNLYQDACADAGPVITPSQSGSSTGLQRAQEGSVDIGNSDIYADKTEYPDLVDHQVAVIPFSVVIGSGVTGVEDLTAQQITDIYTGKINNWSEVGGPDEEITRIVRKPGSGTRITFQTYVLQGGEVELEDASTIVADGSGDVAETLSNTPNAIAYISTAYATDNNLTQVAIDGAKATADAIGTDTYKFWGIAHMYTNGEATGLAAAFIEYMASDAPEVVQVRDDQGFIAISSIEQSVLDAKAPQN